MTHEKMNHDLKYISRKEVKQLMEVVSFAQTCFRVISPLAPRVLFAPKLPSRQTVISDRLKNLPVLRTLYIDPSTRARGANLALEKVEGIGYL
jgi:hypothetical protein